MNSESVKSISFNTLSSLPFFFAGLPALLVSALPVPALPALSAAPVPPRNSKLLLVLLLTLIFLFFK